MIATTVQLLCQWSVCETRSTSSYPTLSNPLLSHSSVLESLGVLYDPTLLPPLDAASITRSDIEDVLRPVRKEHGRVKLNNSVPRAVLFLTDFQGNHWEAVYCSLDLVFAYKELNVLGFFSASSIYNDDCLVPTIWRTISCEKIVTVLRQRKEWGKLRVHIFCSFSPLFDILHSKFGQASTCETWIQICGSICRRMIYILSFMDWGELENSRILVQNSCWCWLYPIWPTLYGIMIYETFYT